METWYELKNILDPKRKDKVKVSIVYHDKGGKTHTMDNLRHSYHRYEKQDLIPDLENKEVNFEAGKSFKIIRANLKVVQEGMVLTNTGSREDKDGGLYIEDENENIFDLTLFGNEHKHYSKRVLGTVLLNTDFKAIVRDEMDSNEYPLKDDRTGFDFGHKLSRKLKKAILPWLEEGLNKLKNEGATSETNDMGEANKAIDKLIRSITDEDLSGLGVKVPEDLDSAIRFEFNPVSVSSQTSRNVRVFIDTEEIAVGETIHLELKNNLGVTINGAAVAASDFQLDSDTFKVPDPESGKNISAHTIQVSCILDKAEDDLTAKWNTKKDTTHLICKAKDPPPKLSGELLFWNQARCLSCPATRWSPVTSFSVIGSHFGLRS